MVQYDLIIGMPGRNIQKVYLEDSYYHLYNRGVNKEAVFREEADYIVFLNLLKRYLSYEEIKDRQGRAYPSFHRDVELLAYCLMSNHFHFLIYQKRADGISELLRSLTTSYGMYFNKKYKRVGPVFQSRFKASMISSDKYLQHISRYIHLNPKDYQNYEFSSLPYYLGRQSASWVQPAKILALFDSTNEYSQFLADYEDYGKSIDQIKSELADR